VSQAKECNSIGTPEIDFTELYFLILKNKLIGITQFYENIVTMLGL
jgi:hypothetical protein